MANPQARANIFHEDVPEGARRLQEQDWAAYESKLTKKRTENCQKTLQSIFGGEAEGQPTVGLVFSGGGWRAMASGVALLDALSIPYETTDSTTVKLLDAVTYAFGLSGGSWALMAAIAGKEKRNPFHYKADNLQTQTNPWLHSATNPQSFSPLDHKYDGLINMVSKKNVDAALERSGLSRLANSMSPIDTTVMSACLFGTGTKVETWGHFLAANLLGFLDEDGAASKDLKFRKKLSSLRESIEDGSFPFVVCSAIANYEAPTERDTDPRVKDSKGRAIDAKKKPRRYNWVEISPYFIRNLTTLQFTEDVDTSSIYFLKGHDTEEQPDARRNDIRLHQVMGVCGSAIAFDYDSLAKSAPGIISWVPDFIRKHVTKVQEDGAVLSGTLTGLSIGSHPRAIVDTCHDAGLDINVPFPSIFQSSAMRKLDVVLVMDAGQGAADATELQNAIDRGYITVKEIDWTTGGIKTAAVNLRAPFGKERFRVYETNEGTTIIYFLGLTERSTKNVVLTEAELIKDVESLRKAAEPLNEVLKACIKRKIKVPKVVDIISPASPAGLSASQASPLMKADSTAPIRRTASPGDRPQRFEMSPMVRNQIASIEAAQVGAKQVRFPIKFKKAPILFDTEAAQYFIKVWAAKGNLKYTIDRFFAVDDVLDGLGDQYRNEVIFELEREAIAMLSLKGDTDAFLTRLKEINERMLSESKVASEVDFFQGLAEVGILQLKSGEVKTLQSDEISHSYLRYAPEWADFYATTAVIRYLAPTDMKVAEQQAFLANIERIGCSPQPSSALNTVRIHDFLRGNFTVFLGSLVMKLKQEAKIDVLKAAAKFVTTQYLQQLADFGTDSLKGTAGDLEFMVMHMAGNLCDFYTEMLNFEGEVNVEMDLSDPWRRTVLVNFAEQAESIIKAIESSGKDYKASVVSATKHIFLISEAVARSPSIHSYMLFRVLSETDLVKLLNTPTEPMLDVKLTSNKGLLRKAVPVQKEGTPSESIPYATEELMLRVTAAVYEVGGSKVKPFITVFKGLHPAFQVNLKIAADHSFPGALKRFFIRAIGRLSFKTTEDEIKELCKSYGAPVPTAFPPAIRDAKREAVIALAKSLVDSIVASMAQPVTNNSDGKASTATDIPFRHLNDNEFFYRSLFAIADALHVEARLPLPDIREKLFTSIMKTDLNKANLEFMADLMEADCNDQTMSILTIDCSRVDTEAIGTILSIARRYRRFLRINAINEVTASDQRIIDAIRRDIDAINDKSFLMDNRIAQGYWSYIKSWIPGSK